MVGDSTKTSLRTYLYSSPLTFFLIVFSHRAHYLESWVVQLRIVKEVQLIVSVLNPPSVALHHEDRSSHGYGPASACSFSSVGMCAAFGGRQSNAHSGFTEGLWHS